MSCSTGSAARRRKPASAARPPPPEPAMNLPRPTILIALTVALVCAAGCSLAPTYERPDVPVAGAYKEAPGWVPAQPGDGVDRGAGWTLFQDPELDALIGRVEVSNQNVAAATAAYAQARA